MSWIPSPLRKAGNLFGQHRRELGFGVSTAFLSGFGQTFFVSLFLVSLTAQIGISNGHFGMLYAVATLASAACLPFAGRQIDRLSSAVALVIGCAGIAASLVMLSIAHSVWMLVPALFGLRAFGQGGMSLLSASTMAKYFHRSRGVALGASMLGYPLSEMVLPAAMIMLIAWIGFQFSLAACAGLVIATGLILRLTLFRKPFVPEASLPASDPAASSATSAVREFRGWRDPLFLLITGSSLASPFIGTIFFLYLVPITEFKGWDTAWIAGAFTVFAIIRAMSGVGIGFFIDRFNAVRLFPWASAIIASAFVTLWAAQSPWTGLGFFMLLGLGFGSGAIHTAMMAEIYGSQRIGEVRGLSSSAGVLATALGPALAGWALERGVSFDGLLLGCMTLAVLSAGAATFVPRMARTHRL